MANFSVQIFATNLLAVYEHYKRAFNATLLFDGKASDQCQVWRGATNIKII